MPIEPTALIPTASTSSATSLGTPPPEATINSVVGIRSDASLDDLIPLELREAVAKAEKDKENDSPPEKPPQKTAPLEKESPGKGTTTAKTGEVPAQVQQDAGGDEADDDTALDLSTENIEKLLEGDPDAVIAKDGEEGEADETPFWHEDKEYKELIKRTSNVGIKQEQLDKIIASASDTKVIANNKYTTGLESELTNTKNTNELLINEVERLKQVERAAHFDTLQETKDKYGQPMNDAAASIRRLLQIEGADVPVNSILSAENKTAFTDLIKNVNFDDETLTELTNQWRNYRDLHFKYANDRAEAQKDLAKHLTTNIPEDTAKKILNNSLIEFVKADPKYKYIQDAIQDPQGLTEHEEVSNLLRVAQGNFKALTKAISNPSDFAKNNEWLSALAKYTMEAAHASLKEKEHTILKEAHEARMNDFRKVIVAYRKLLSSAKGITGGKGSAVPSKVTTNGSDGDSTLEEFNSILSGKKKIEDIIPGLK